MRTILRFSGLALLVAGLLAPAALAGKASEAAKAQAGSMKVDDKAGAFTAEGISAAEGKFDGVTFKARTHLTVATRNAVPESKKADFEATKGDMTKLNRLFSDWTHDLANDKDRKEVGVFVLVYSRGDKLFVKAIADKASDVHRHFTDKDLSDLEKKLFASFKAAKQQAGDEAKKTHDGGLMSATTFVIEQLEDTSLPAGKVTSDEHKNSSTGGMSIMGWVCIAGAVILAIWLVVALIRMMTGSVNGYGGGYGGGMGGGGGMGFMGGMMGGLFGAMAGMYLYDQFTGGHHYSDNYGGGNDGYDNSGGGSSDTGEGNFDGGSEGQGAGDWGDSGGGADTGGGGDWGDSGGGDTGGGGDWGGGGGDMGGGGDW